MGPRTKDAWAYDAPTVEGWATASPDSETLRSRVAQTPSCPRASRDYVKAAAWLFAFLFGPALVALIVLLAV